MFNKEELKKICIKNQSELDLAIGNYIKNYSFYKSYSHTNGIYNDDDNYLSVGILVNNVFKRYDELDCNTDYNRNIKNTVFLKKVGDKFKLFPANSIDLKSLSATFNSKILDYLSIEIIGYDISSKLLGLKSVKEKYVGRKFKPGNYSIVFGISRKLDKEVCIIKIYDDNLNREIGFSVADVKFSLPNLSGYSIPKDKTIKIGDIVKLKKDEFNNKWSVISVMANTTSKKMSVNSNTRYKDLITIQSHDGIIKTVYAKYLKKI